MKEIFSSIIALCFVVLIIVMIGMGAIKLVQMWKDLPEKPPSTEKWIGICIDSDLNEERYEAQYERAGVKELKKDCEFRGVSRDIIGCYGNDHYKFLCKNN